MTAPRTPRRLWPFALLAILIAVAAIAGASLGYSLRLDLPDVNTLEDYSPPVITRILARDGSLLHTFAEERRIVIDYRDIPEVFRQALVAVEDSNFYDHAGLDPRGVARAVLRNVVSLRTAQGASTLTQQLARNLFLHPDKTFRRKFQEALLALEIERRYAKDEILRFYCNQVYMGHGRYGLEAASRFYLGKPVAEVDTAEAALLAGVIQRPESLSPFKNPERSARRRDHVLGRMLDVGFLTEEEVARAREVPLPKRDARRKSKGAAYFVEDVRRWLQSRFGDASIYRAGLEVRTTLDPRMQALAANSVEAGLRALDKRQGWRGATARVPEGEDAATWQPESWAGGIAVGDVTDGVVVSSAKGRAMVRVGAWTGALGPDELRWTVKERRAATLSVGEVVRVRVVAADEGTVTLALEQEPLVEGALVALDPATGAVYALVGGFDFGRSEFNRATQARRQTGSAFKPLVFAAALAKGWTLADTLVDQPIVFIDRREPTPYLPKNYTDHYYGMVTLRRALEKSANVATVRLLNGVGAGSVIDVAQRLGISSNLRPYPSLALGSFEVSLVELTSAYGTFANQGVRVEPHLVEEVRDRSGAVLFSVEPDVRDALSPQIAFLMNRVLRGVITDGTGHAAAGLGQPLAGKTGTTDDNTDAWFLGYSAELALGVWVGFDEKKSIGDRETGAQAALPIWRGFMEQHYAATNAPEFEQPDDINVVVIDRDTGLRANASARCNRLSESFARGSEPTRHCSRAEHARLRLPYAFHRFPLSERGELLVPDLDLHGLLAEEPRVYLSEGGMRLEYASASGHISLPLRLVSGGGGEGLPESILTQLEAMEQDPATWVGTDGHPARIEFIRY